MISVQFHRQRGVFLALAILLLIPALAAAQDYRGKVQGSITDASNAAIAGAKVMLRNVGTGVEVTRQTARKRSEQLEAAGQTRYQHERRTLALDLHMEVEAVETHVSRRRPD